MQHVFFTPIEFSETFKKCTVASLLLQATTVGGGAVENVSEILYSGCVGATLAGLNLHPAVFVRSVSEACGFGYEMKRNCPTAQKLRQKPTPARRTPTVVTTLVFGPLKYLMHSCKIV